ncbi:UNVERIFIED_CONTAM: hypothetical protein FKN15_007284 [Acipenser sinensis]
MVFYTCGPNEAMVVSGFCRAPPLLIAGGRAFVIPCIQQIQRISLNTLTLNVKSDKVYTRHGVPISVTGIAQVKIQGQNKEMLAAACQMFMGKSEQEIAHIALETLEGHQRAIMAHMTVEEIYKDRKKFSEQVFKVASSDLVNMGISVVSYTLKDVHDDQIKGEAEAFAVEVKARAEAEQMSKKAEAFKQYKEAAMVDMLLEKLPLIAEEISKPLSEAKKVTMVSSGNGDVGVAKLTGEVLDIMKRLPEAMEKLTGVSITQLSLES